MEYSLAELKKLIASMTGYVVLYRQHGGAIAPLFYTPSVPGFSGLSEQEYLDLYGGNAAAVVAERDLPELNEKLVKVLSGAGDQELTYRTRHKTQGFVWTHVHLHLLGTCGGDKIIVGNFANVTASLAVPDMLLDQTNQKIYVIERGSFDLLYANAVAQADKQGAPVIGQTCYQYIRNLPAPCAQCVANRIQGENILDTVWHDDTRSKTYGVKAVPLTFFGKSAYAFFIDDLTHHINLEAALRLEQEKYRAATEGANLRVYEYDIVNHTIYLPEHSRMLFGVPSRVVSGVPDSVLPLFQKEDYEKVRRFFARIDRGEKIVSASFQMQAVNGYAPYLRYTFTTAFDENGQPVKAYAVAEDITAQKRAEDDFNATVQALLAANPNALCSYKLNLSQNLCSEEHGVSGYIRTLLRSDTADQLFASLLSIIPDPRQQENAVRFFDRKSLLKRFDAGKKTLHLDYQRRGESGRILWVRTFVNMLKNPGTEDVTAVFYSEDITSEKRNSEIFRIITNREYDYVGLLHPQTAQMEFIILNATLPQKYGDAFGQPGRLYDFDKVRRFAADNWIDPADHEYFWEASSIPHVKAELEQKGHSELSVRGHYTGHPEKVMCRKIQHYYLGEDEDAILVIQTDVTATYLQQQKEAEQARAEAQRVEDIIDSVATGICVFRMPDADHLEGEFVNLQMFRIIGLTPPDSLDARQKMMEDPMVAAYMKDAFLAVHPEDIAKVRQAFHDGYNSQHFTAGDYRILKKDGSSVWINQNATLREIRPDCHVFYATYRVVDREMQLKAELHQQLEEAQQLRNQADEANAAKSDFLSRMSHDIRTPLNGIIGMTYLTREMDLPAAARENLDKIDTSSKFLLSLINEVLDMSKAESGKIELHPEPYDPSVFFEYLDSVIAPLCKEKNIHFVIDTHGDNTVIPMMDTLRINQIFFNLLSNAVKFTPEGGTVTYRLHEHQTRPGRLAMEAEVLDNGIGMSPEFQKHLFEPFSQEMRNDNSNIRGTGLGLAIVKKLLDLMGCTITVRSTPGQGTCFRICGEFDCVPAAKAPVQTESAAPHPLAVLAGCHVLLCEDHPLNQEIAKVLLNEKKVMVSIAEDGQQGLAKFEDSAAWYYSAVLMDIRMPVMDGYEAAKAIRALKRPDAAAIPIIAMTADAFSDDVQKCREAGMDDHIAKPIDPEQLYDKLAQAIRKYRLSRDR